MSTLLMEIAADVALLWLVWQQERIMRELGAAADILKQQRDALADWLNVNGWEVTYEAERLVIGRAEDEEEERLRR